MRFRLRTLLVMLALGLTVGGYFWFCTWFIETVIPIGDFDLVSGPYSPFR